MTTWYKRTIILPEGVPETGVLTTWTTAGSITASWKPWAAKTNPWLEMYSREDLISGDRDWETLLFFCTM